MSRNINVFVSVLAVRAVRGALREPPLKASFEEQIVT